MTILERSTKRERLTEKLERGCKAEKTRVHDGNRTGGPDKTQEEGEDKKNSRPRKTVERIRHILTHVGSGHKRLERKKELQPLKKIIHSCQMDEKT